MCLFGVIKVLCDTTSLLILWCERTSLKSIKRKLLDKNLNLSNTDADLQGVLQLPIATNFNYYSTHDFHSSEDVQSSFSNKTFSAFHHNIRGIEANFDSLHQLLIDLNKSFSIISLSETKIRHGKDQILNTNMTGYHFLAQPTLSEAGGAGIFIKDNLSYIQRR